MVVPSLSKNWREIVARNGPRVLILSSLTWVSSWCSTTGGYPVYRWNMAAACRLIALGAVIGATTAGLESTAQPHPCAWSRRIHETSPDRLEASTQWLRHPFGFGVFPLSADKAEAKRKKDMEVAAVREATALFKGAVKAEWDAAIEENVRRKELASQQAAAVAAAEQFSVLGSRGGRQGDQLGTSSGDAKGISLERKWQQIKALIRPGAMRHGHLSLRKIQLYPLRGPACPDCLKRGAKFCEPNCSPERHRSYLEEVCDAFSSLR